MQDIKVNEFVRCIKTKEYLGITEGTYYEVVKVSRLKNDDDILIRFRNDDNILMNSHLSDNYFIKSQPISVIDSLYRMNWISKEKSNELIELYKMDMLESTDILSVNKKHVIELDVNSDDIEDICYTITSKEGYINAYLNDDEEFNRKFDL